MFSILVPCFNEEAVVRFFYREIKKYLHQTTYELIFVDDGSTDDTLKILKKLAENDSRVRYISLSRNFGKEAAIMAGLIHARGEAVIIMDADLQHPPALVPELIHYYQKGYDQVIARRNREGEFFLRAWVSKVFYRVMNRLSDVSLVDGVGDFRLLSRRAVNVLLSLDEYNRFSKGLFSWIGFKKIVIQYKNVSREFGESKWSFGSLVNYGIDGIISFNNKPLRLSIYMGLGITLTSLLYIFIMVMKTFIFGVEVKGYVTIMSAILLLGGIQLMFLGVIGEYIGRIYYETKKRPHFIIQEESAFVNKKRGVGSHLLRYD